MGEFDAGGRDLWERDFALLLGVVLALGFLVGEERVRTRALVAAHVRFFHVLVQVLGLLFQQVLQAGLVGALLALVVGDLRVRVLVVAEQQTTDLMSAHLNLNPFIYF